MPGANSARRNMAQLVPLPTPLSLPTQRISGPPSLNITAIG